MRPKAEWAIDSEAMRASFSFSKIQLVGQKNIETKHLSLVKARLKLLFWFSKPALFATSGL